MYNGSYQQPYGHPSVPAPQMNAPYGAAPQQQQYFQTAPQQFQPPQAHMSYPAAVPFYQQPQAPNPALQIATDPNAFAQMFKSHLAALTFNSKPVITDLTLLSHEHVSRMAHVVAQCLEEHVLTCPPSYRLPALYTIDSICKNVGVPYTTLWADRIMRMFMETYRLVDQGVKVRMEELLATWRNAGINGSPLFGDAAQWSIQQAIYGNAAPPSSLGSNAIRSPLHQPSHATRSPMHQQQAAQPSQQQNLQRNRTIDRLNRLLAIGTHDQHHNLHLYDDSRMQALTKLRALVNDTPLSGEEMGQIEQQLNALEAEVDSRRQSAAPVVENVTSRTHSPRPNGGPAGLPPSLAGALANISKLGVVTSTTPPVSHASLAGAGGSIAASSCSAQNLIASLRQAGLLPADKPAQSSAPAPQQDIEYTNMIMSLNLKLTTADMQRELPLGSLEAIHFKELPLQCRQCANRYPTGAKGQASMDQHLDWHFRQNRRAKDSSVRGQSRSWFSRLEEWIRGGHDDEAPSKRSEHGEAGSNRSHSALTPAQEAELKAATNSFVPAPSDDPGVATKPCPICKELFKSEWSEEEEEWIWKNAVKVNGVYYHGSCHYSAKTLSSTVKQSSGNGSRESTPLGDAIPSKIPAGNRLGKIKEEQDFAPSPAAVAGTKRKSEGEGGEESAMKLAKVSTGAGKEGQKEGEGAVKGEESRGTAEETKS